jgi:NADPH:quinone reductase-like Zn-dependent oxidoreductase
MRALIMREHGGLSVLQSENVPAPDIENPNDVRVLIKAAALNRLDLWTLQGLPGLTLRFPHVLGGDGAGLVEAVGSAVTAFKPGDRVLINPGLSCYQCDRCRAGEHSLCRSYRLLGEHVSGTLAEHVVVPDLNLAHIPNLPDDHQPLIWEEAAAFTLVTLTAWRMVVTKAALRPGEVILIWGIGGGVASAAMRIATLAGGSTIVTSSSREKLQIAKELGADVTLNHNEVDVAKEVRRLTNRRGADVVIDSVGEATWEHSLRALANAGRLVSCGGTSGPMVVTDVRRLFWHQYHIMGSTMGTAEEFREIVRVLSQGRLRPRVDSVFPMDRARDAFERLRSGNQMGKVVVRVNE